MRIYFHRSCFDGIASATMAAWLLQRTADEHSFIFEPVDYSVRSVWEGKSLDERSCVVDFLYHPKAIYWWDHHVSPFVSPEGRANYGHRKSPLLTWDPDAPSCAGLIFREIRKQGLGAAHLEDTVRWADKLDAAQYDSPEEAVLQLSPARLIALSFVVEDSPGYYEFLIRSLLLTTVDEVAANPSCRMFCDEAARRYNLGLELFRRRSSFEAGIVFYDIAVGNEIVDRMMPYYLYPQAEYSLGIVRSTDRKVKLTCNASPWRKPSGPHVGEIFARYGGGGHRDVGSAFMEGGEDPRVVLAMVARELRAG